MRWHLCGHADKGREFVIGVYPMLRDESCFCVAADFDKATWQQDVRAFLETCHLPWSGPGRATAGTFDSFLMKPFPPHWHASWVPHTHENHGSRPEVGEPKGVESFRVVVVDPE